MSDHGEEKARRFRPGERQVVVVIATGLTRAQAHQRARKLLPKGADYRGFTYNPKTGRCCFT